MVRSPFKMLSLCSHLMRQMVVEGHTRVRRPANHVYVPSVARVPWHHLPPQVRVEYPPANPLVIGTHGVGEDRFLLVRPRAVNLKKWARVRHVR